MNLTKTEKITFNLIIEDLRLVNTLMVAKYHNYTPYIAMALQPYLGLITSGIIIWSQKVKALKEIIPRFNKKEEEYYTELRSNIKFWENNFSFLYKKLHSTYIDSDKYFSNKCKPLAKKLKLYDIYGCFIIDGYYCDNTILDCLFTPFFTLGKSNKDYIRNMSEFMGKLIVAFGVHNKAPLSLNNNLKFSTKDFGGFCKSPTAYTKYDKSFVIFSVLCTINFLVFGIDKYILDETPTKLRLIYILYYYLIDLLKEINNVFNSNFSMDNKWYFRNMRNCMAHYGLGNVLKQNEVMEDDMFGGLTNKFFSCHWLSLKNSLVSELTQLSFQLEAYLKI